MPSAAFELRNREGVAGEKRVQQVFADAGCGTWWRFEGSKRDLVVQHRSGLFDFLEIKNEDKYATSPNLCCEYVQKASSRPKFSGLAMSESTVCIHTFGQLCILYRTQLMRLHIAEGRGPGGYEFTMFKGADNENGGFLIPKRGIVNRFWAEEIEIARLPQSRVFKEIRRG